MIIEFTLCCGWSALLGPPAVSFGWSEPPQPGWPPGCCYQSRLMSRGVGTIKSLRVLWWIRPFSRHSNEMCERHANYFHSSGVTDNALKAATLTRNHVVNAFTSSVRRLMEQYCAVLRERRCCHKWFQLWSNVKMEVMISEKKCSEK